MQRHLARALVALLATGFGIIAVVGAQPRQAARPDSEYVVQFEGPILDVWKAALTAAGADILHYLPDFAFKVRLSRGDVSRVSQLPGVTAVTAFERDGRFARGLVRGGTRAYVVVLERRANAAAVAAAIAQTGSQVVRGGGSRVLVVADPAQLDAIADLADVRSIENFALYEKHNEYGAGLVGGAFAHAAGFDGSTQTIAVADTGLGSGQAGSAHADLPAGRIASIFNWPGAPSTCFDAVVDDGAADVDTGHGTHVAMTAIGGGQSDGLGRGTAPGARLIFQSIENWVYASPICALLLGITDGYYLVGIPSDISELLAQSHDGGARVQSISWGSEAAGGYTDASANADGFVWTRRDMTIAMSAGNSGVDSNGDGVVDASSITSPATAKNVIAVGASENDRDSRWDCDTALSYTDCAEQGGQNALFSYGAGFAGRYPANPLRDDPSGGNAQQLAAFSSRGPTIDGRIKPDVVAPGTWILSGYSDRFQQHYDPTPNPLNGHYQYDGWGHPFNGAYKYMGGTSMSAPLVAGGAAVIRDFYEKTSQHSASAALVKATLINSADDLLDENNDGVDDNALPIPNTHEGWGRINLTKATDGSSQFADEATNLSTGERAVFAVSVPPSATPLKITLVWSDYPSVASAARALVNDLDLKVVAPDGAIYLGNAFAAGWSVPGGSPDRLNNVENVYVSTPVGGTWSVSISGFNVPMGPQPFALVVDGVTGPLGPPDLTAAPAVMTVTAAAPTTTEAGPSAAGFRIARSGDTSAAVQVSYTVAGSATSGSDYTALPGHILIPAGQASATVPVWPMNDDFYEPDETVVLTLGGDLAYDIGEPSSATVTIVNDDQKTDLAVTAMSAPTPLGAGDTVTVSATTKNQGVGTAPPSSTGFYLSSNSTFDAADIFLASQAVSSLVAGALEVQSTSVRIPVATAGGTYYIIAKADWENALAETSEANNVRASSSIKIGPDLVVTAMSAPSSAAAGATIVVNETTKNQGAGVASASVTSFYLSTNTLFETSDVPLGQRAIAGLSPGAFSSDSTTLAIPPMTAGGVYYIVAKADGTASVSESSETNNVKASASIRIGADLSVFAVTAPAMAGVGTTITVADTTNNGGAGGSPPSVTGFYLSADGTLNATDTPLHQRDVPALDAGATHTLETQLTIPANTLAGRHYIIAKADGPGSISESNESNNTRARAINIGPDLTVSDVVAGATSGAGKPLTVTATIANEGLDAASSTTASVYLSTNITYETSDVLLGSQSVDALAGSSSRSVSLPGTIPAGMATGIYYVLVRVDPHNTVAEFSDTNNVGRSSSMRVGPDFTVTALSGPATAVAGTTVVFNDTTTNAGGGDAPASVTSFYLSTNSLLDASDTPLETRDVPALVGGAAHASGTSLRLPPNLTVATYYIIAKADGPAQLGETTENNNTRSVSFKVTAQ